jgi:hypothetical protein
MMENKAWRWVDMADIDAGYCIKELVTDMYIGPDSDRYRVATRQHSARFTREEAIEYIKDGAFVEAGKEYRIESV